MASLRICSSSSSKSKNKIDANNGASSFTGPDYKPFHSSSFRYRLTYIHRYVINSGCVMCTGYFLSQPITTLENVSYISLAQPELKKLWIISQTSYRTVAIISGQCQYM